MIKKDLIRTNVALRNQLAVIEFIAAMAEKAGVLVNQDEFIKMVLLREKSISTSIGYGIAIPHAKTAVIKMPFIAYVSVQEPFEWDEVTQDRVRAIFLIGVPEKNTDKLHLKAISEISKKLIDEDFRKRLFACQNDEAAYGLLAAIDQDIR